MTERSESERATKLANLSDGELLNYCGDDARKWAEAFCQIKQNQDWSASDIDESLMLGWFANAIEHSSDVRGRLSAQDQKPVAWIDFADNGNVRLWTSEKHRATAELASGRKMTPVYAAPPPAAGWEDKLLSIISALDRASGDTDPSDIGTDEECRDQYPVIWAMQQLCALRRNAPPDSGAGKSEPVWHDGAPPKPWCDEWFIAQTTFNDRVVLTALPEEYSYDFKTADDTYIKADKIKRWMQFPDSQYVPHNNSGKIDPSSLPDHGGADAGVRERLMPLSDINDLDDVCRELGIQDSHITPAEAVRELNAEIERLTPYQDELLKIANDVGEPNDPFAAWERIAALSKPAPVAANASAEARLRKAAHRYMKSVERLGENSGYNKLTFFEAPIIRMPSDDLAKEAEQRWRELNDAGVALKEALSAHPNASDCDKQKECCDLAAKEPCSDCPFPNPDATVRGFTDLERALLIAAKAAQNYIANTESELGMTLKSGDLLRAAIAKAEACEISASHASDCDKQGER